MHDHAYSAACFVRNGTLTTQCPNRCVKSVRIRSFSGLYFLGLKTEDRKYLPVFSPNAGKYGPEKLRIRTLLRSEYLS